ncbi:MAG: CDP-alcohol phosphatidyltransferase family protein [Chthoniobacterales bacterium]|nr:CDP-alcohol phosphatidyltransferase family protein [Chthoniobacterales bacterium]
MRSGADLPLFVLPRVRRVLILADESADWKVAGLRQLDRLVFSLAEFARSVGERITVSVWWSPGALHDDRWLPAGSRSNWTDLSDLAAGPADEDDEIDLVLSTRLFMFRDGIPQLLAAMPALATHAVGAPASWQSYHDTFERAFSADSTIPQTQPWRYLHDTRDIAGCERAFLRHSGKSQDGLVSRYVNRPLSRTLSRVLLKLSILPNTWSIAIFALPVSACLLFLRGTDVAFFIGCTVFQLYSIIDGCDGEIARAKFLQTDFGRRLDSFLDLVGNILLALCLGVGLAHQWQRGHASGWFYVLEGFAAALFIGLSEGIVFVRRSRPAGPAPESKWNGAIYQRHTEFLERSGILFLGEKFAWWLVQLTKRDMAMLAFLILAAVGFPAGILHLLLVVSGVSAALAGNAFLRQPAPALPQEAS